MSKITQKILTLLVVVALLFGVCATTVSAATAEGGVIAANGTAGGKDTGTKPETGEEDSDDDLKSGSLTKGWLDIQYVGNEITVIIAPDKEAILRTRTDDIKEILAFLVEAAKEIVVGDLLEEVLPDGSITDIDPNTIWFDALEGYLGKQYGDDVDNKYVAFLKDSLNDEQVLEDFAKYICALLKAGVLSGVVDLEDLPSKDGIEEYIVKMLNDYVDAYIDNYVEEAVEDYIAYCLDPTLTKTDVIAVAESYLISYVREALENYIASLKGEPTTDNEFQAQIEEFAASYIKDYVVSAVREYVEAKVNDEDAADTTVNTYIEEFITAEINSRVDTYIKNKLEGKEPTDDIDKLVNEYAGDYISSYIEEAVRAYIDSKIEGTTPDENEVNAYIEDFVNREISERIDTYIDNKVNGNGADTGDAVDKLIEEYADKYINDYVYESVKAYVEAKVGKDTIPEGAIYTYIEQLVTAEIDERVDNYITNKLNGNGADTGDAVDKLIVDYADTFVSEYINTAVSNYIDGIINGNLEDNVVNAFIKNAVDAEIERRIDTYIDSKLSGIPSDDGVDKLVADYADGCVEKYISDAVTAYLNDRLGGNTPETNTVNSYIESFVNQEIRDRIDNYIDNYGNEPENDIDKLIAEYADASINEYIEKAVENYINAVTGGNNAGNSAVNTYIEKVVNDKIGELIGQYIENTVSGDTSNDDPVYALVAKHADKVVSDYVGQAFEDYINAKFHGGTMDESLMALIDAEIQAQFDKYYNEQIDAFIEYVANGRTGDKPELYEQIDTKVSETVIPLIRAESGYILDRDQAEQIYYSPDFPLAEYLADIDFNDSETKNFIMGTLSEQDYRDAYAKVDVSELTKKALADTTIKQTIENKIVIKDVLKSIDDPTVLINNVDVSSLLADAIKNDDVKAAIKAEINIDEALKSIGTDNINTIIGTVNLNAVLMDALANKDVQDAIRSKIDVNEVLASIGKENITAKIEVDKVLKDALANDDVKAAIKAEIDVDTILASIGTDNIDTIIGTVNLGAVLADALADKDIVDAFKKDIKVDDILKSMTDDDIDKIIGAVNLDDILKEALKDEKVQELVKSKIDIDDVLVSIGVENIEKVIATVDVQQILDKVDDAKLAEILDNMYAEYTDEEVVELITEIVKEFKANDNEKLNALIAKINEQVKEKIRSGELDDKFISLFGVKITDLLAEIDVVGRIIGKYYTDTVTELEKTPAGVRSYAALLGLVRDVSVNGLTIYGNSDKGMVFIRENIEQLLRDIPNLDEIENMEAEDMFLSYTFKAVTDFGDCEFKVTVRAGGGFDAIKKVASIINRNIEYSIDENYNIVLKVNVPDELAKAVLKACQSGRVPDALKQKVFAALSADVDDMYAFVNNITFDDLMQIFEYVDFDKILDHRFVSRFEKLDGLTEAQIQAKVAEYEGYYNLALKYLARA